MERPVRCGLLTAAHRAHNFVSAGDIIGGNSGSPVINRAGEVVGLIFDGNIESLAGNYVYYEQTSRAIAVHNAGMTEVLKSCTEPTRG